MNMFDFCVIICTYLRPIPIVKLLDSIRTQTTVPDEILIIDGSPNDDTYIEIGKKKYCLNIKYHKVKPEQRGLTKQRNVGVSMVNPNNKVVIFLDDDVILEHDFFEQILVSFEDATVVGCEGFIVNENLWKTKQENTKFSRFSIVMDGYYLPLSKRDRFRAILGLYPFNIQPGCIPKYGHGKGSLPPSGKQYEIEHLMGCMMAYRKSVFSNELFSSFFDGYGLYEDFDFSIKASNYGKLISNTSARLYHHHAPLGRPDFFKYGRMVVRNGHRVWRLKHPHPGAKNILKWHIITLLLAFLRLGNTIIGPKRKDSFMDFLGRMIAWFNLLLSAATKNRH